MKKKKFFSVRNNEKLKKNLPKKNSTKFKTIYIFNTEMIIDNGSIGVTIEQKKKKNKKWDRKAFTYLNDQ